MAGELSLTRTYDRIWAIMRDQAQPLLFDNISTKTATLFRMKMLNAIVRVGGAPHLSFKILKELPTATGYTDLEAITPVRGDPVTRAAYEWKQIYTPVQASGLDIIKTGDGEEADLLQTFIEAAELGLREGIGGSTVGIFSSIADTTLTGISGLQNMFTTSTTTGTVGQLNRANLTAWRHQTQNVSSDFSANGLARFRTLFRQCGRFDENPDSIILTGSTMDNYENALTSSFSTNLPLAGVGPGNQAMIDGGFGNIQYKGALVFDDDGCPANAGYFVNFSKYVKLYVRIGRDAEMGDLVKSRGYDDLVGFVMWAGNLCTTNLGRGGLLQNGDTD